MLSKIEYTKVATTKKDMEAFFNAHCKNAKPDSALGKISFIAQAGLPIIVHGYFDLFDGAKLFSVIII